MEVQRLSKRIQAPPLVTGPLAPVSVKIELYTQKYKFGWVFTIFVGFRKEK